MVLARRGFLFGAGALIAAPAIVRADSLMKVVAPRIVPVHWMIGDSFLQDVCTYDLRASAQAVLLGWYERGKDDLELSVIPRNL